MSDTKTKSYYPLLDVSRVFCALLVVLIHCLGVPDEQPIAKFILMCFSEQAVPFFLIISGFFVIKKLKEKSIKEIALHCVKNYLLVYFAWTIFWMPYIIYTYYIENKGASFFYLVILLIRRIFIAGQGVYWYMLVLAEAVLIVSILVKYKKQKLLYFLAAIGLLLGILYEAEFTAYGYGNINNIFYYIFSWSGNVVMRGIPYIAIGYYLSTRKSFSFVGSLVLYIISSLGMIILYFLGVYDWLCLYPLQAIALFVMSISSNYTAVSTSFSRVCRESSSVIYYMHTVFLYVIFDIIWKGNLIFEVRYILAVLLSLVVYIVIKKLNIPVIKWLFCIK